VQGRPTHRAEPGSWWQDAVFYRISPRSFADSSGNGVGDLEGIRRRMGYLELLGVDAVWLTAVLRGPVTGTSSEAHAVDPLLGDVGALEQLVADAHASGIRVAIDLVVSRRDLGSAGNTAELTSAVRFWLERGVDGFRVCTAPGVVAPADRAVRELLRIVRPIADEHGGVLGAFVDADWYRAEGASRLHLGVDVRFGDAGWDGDALAAVIEQSITDQLAGQVAPVWGRVTRDQFHPVTRYGSGTTGVARSRAMLLVKLALPGAVGLENGEELGIPDADLPGRAGQDPMSGLMPWEGTEPPFGFSTAPGNWWPITSEWAPYTVEAQLEDPGSTLSLYRRALDLHRKHSAFAASAGIEWYDGPPGCFAFSRGGLTCALNASGASVPLPSGVVLLASSPLDGDLLPEDTAVWLVTFQD
jgi:alpha-glucosidase